MKTDGRKKAQEAQGSDEALFNITARNIGGGTFLARVQDQDFRRGSKRGIDAAVSKCAWAFCEARHMKFISLRQYGSASLWILTAHSAPFCGDKSEVKS